VDVVGPAAVCIPSPPVCASWAGARATCQAGNGYSNSNQRSFHHDCLIRNCLASCFQKLAALVSYNEAMAQDETQPPAAAFEASLDELERVVKELEKGELTLERSLELFEKGMKLTEDCKKQLEEAETRVEMLMKRGSKTIAVPFDPSQDNSSK
jgi:exodeoxyribonuclease VII small subunit